MKNAAKSFKVYKNEFKSLKSQQVRWNQCTHCLIIKIDKKRCQGIEINWNYIKFLKFMQMLWKHLSLIKYKQIVKIMQNAITSLKFYKMITNHWNATKHHKICKV